ncbi:uncharacterized protein BJ212DRAFT_1486754 [Suillus subaureus]|uniref:Uncharacterized protein n=1 Tax=Suillus subaureus TaxID=48587 RepID=A0A9P7DVH4_9AGAM|nr:uncharacterized protein BJ212DRAFT_1486754 [Suillus subaureus]KAG1804221.1 hypothetical protein BJ212DRAFT_1486754 [Suillus subaureus]
MLSKKLGSQKINPALVESWPSVFSGLEIIANHITFSHRDGGGSPSLLDLLVSLGRNHHATLALADLNAELDYSPGAMVYIVLEHFVGPWGNGEWASASACALRPLLEYYPLFQEGKTNASESWVGSIADPDDFWMQDKYCKANPEKSRLETSGSDCRRQRWMRLDYRNQS